MPKTSLNDAMPVMANFFGLADLRYRRYRTLQTMVIVGRIALHAARRRPVPTPVGPDGFASLAGAGARPGCGPRVEALSVHRQLVEAGFLLGTDEKEGANRCP